MSENKREDMVFRMCASALMVAILLFGTLELMNVIHI